MNIRKALRGLVLFLAVLLRLGADVQTLGMSGTGDVARHAPAAVNAQNEETLKRAEELLTLSESQNKNNHDLAIQTALQALALWQAAGHKEGTARAYVCLGRYHLAKSDLPEAIQNYERALQLYRELNATEKQAGVLTSLGFIAGRKGEWEDSISLLTRARGLLGTDEEPYERGRIAAGLANVFNESGLPDAALQLYQEALEFFRQTPETRDDLMAVVNIGSTYHLKGDYPAALTHLRQALDGFTPNSLEAALCHEYLGRVYISTAEYDAALQHLQAALPIYTNAGNHKEAAQVTGLMGHIYQQRGQLGPSRHHYRQALKTFTRLSDQINQAAVYYALGRLELKAGNHAAAEKHLLLSIQVTETIRRLSNSRDLTAAFSATIYERYEKYIECLMRQREAQPARGLVVQAFEISERARARSLAELLRATQTGLGPGLDPELAEQEKTLRQSLRVREDHRVALLSSKKDEREALAALETEMARLEAAYKQVAEAIRSRHPSYWELTRPEAWDLRRIQVQVISDAETVLLEYGLGEDKSYVWAVTRDSIRSYEIPARALITESAGKVYKSLEAFPGTAAAEEFTPAAQELGRMVLSPVAAELNKRRVIVVADGALNYIPFQVLPVPSLGNEPLVASHEVVNAPSATILGELRQGAAQHRPAAKVLAAFGDPVFAPDNARRNEAGGGGELAAAQTFEGARWRHVRRDIELDADSLDPSAIPRLFYAKRELAHLLNIAAGGEAFVATDFSATRERLLSTDLTQYAILHFATHGFLNPQRPEHSGLILSTVDRNGKEQNGFVSLQDIYQLRAPTNLVVLSACRTALGKDVRGEGLLGLTRGFMYAGASSVVASLWKVDDEATAELMKQFYSNMLKEGMTPAEALRAAQNSVRQNPDWRSPHYWAAFTLQGEYRRVIKPASAASATASYWKMVAGGGALLALLAGAVWWYRRRPRAARARV